MNFFGINKHVKMTKQHNEWWEKRGEYYIRHGITGKQLLYFQYNPSYVIRDFNLEMLSEPVIMETTQGERPMRKTGKLKFKINGVEQSLYVYDNGFVPFRDEAEGIYEGGRYLDINDEVLDFNKAYNPLCVHNPRYDCPIVPTENTLFVKIEAGEKYENSI